MAFVRVGSKSKLRPGELLEYREGDREAAICNVDGAIYAVDNVCPHAGGPLAQGALHGKWIVCPWHAWEFDCTTGQSDMNADVRVTRYDVRIEGDDILVDL